MKRTSPAGAAAAALAVLTGLVFACSTEVNQVATPPAGTEAVLGLSTSPSALYVEGDTLYFAMESRLYACPKRACTAPQVIYDQGTRFDRFVGVSGGKLFFVTDASFLSSAPDPALVGCKLGDCATKVTLPIASVAGGGAADWVALDDAAAYVITGSTLRRFALDGSGTTSVGEPWSCTTDAQCGNRALLCDVPTGVCGTCSRSVACVDRATAVCVSGTCLACESDFGRKGRACPTRAAAVCESGVCRPCTQADCLGGTTCIAGVCGKPCGGPGDCTSDERCDQGRCVALLNPGEFCTAKEECGFDNLCIDTVCGARAGAPCTNANFCASRICTGGKCGALSVPTAPRALDLTRRVAVGGGEVFVATSEKLYACPTSGPCSATTARVLLPAPGQTTAFSVSRLLGHAEGRLIFERSPGDVVSCDPAQCATTLREVGSVSNDAREGLRAVGADLVLPTDGAFTQCRDGSCSDVVVGGASARTAVGHRAVGDVRPGAVDGADVYWASSTFYGQPGSQIVRAPR